MPRSNSRKGTPLSETLAPNTSPLARVRSLVVATRSYLSALPLSLIQLAMRVAIGFVFFNSGLLKLKSPQFAVKLFEDEYKLPLLDPTFAAQLATIVEIGVPLLLFVGLATRLATLPLLGMTAIIEIFVYPQAWVEHLLWASVLMLLLTRGPGVFSIDHLIDRHFARRHSH